MEESKKLQESAKLTNISNPYSRYITKDSIPIQDLDLLGKTITVKFKDLNYRLDSKEDFKLRSDFEQKEFKEYETIEAIVVRCDKIKPFVMICVSKDYRHILVYDYRHYSEQVAIYPHQQTELIEQNTIDNYYTVDETLKTDKFEYPKWNRDVSNGIILRADAGEPAYSVIMEHVEDSVRFILSDEVESVLFSTPPVFKSEEEIIKIREKYIGGQKLYANR